jgi:6-phosphogluconolactonase (cycloisomerase 2 family)
VGAAGSYRISHDRSFTPITTAESDHQLDTCWLDNNGRYAYGANYTSGTVSSFRIGRDGSLSLLQAEGRIATDGHLVELDEYAGLPQTVDGDSAPSDFSPLGSPAGIDVL